MKIFKKGHLSEKVIHSWLMELLANAHIPESHFAVAAAFRAQVAGQDDYYFAGVNVENMDHRLSTHGEEGAMAALVTGLGASATIAEGWVLGRAGDAPSATALASCCGKCRQQIAGLAPLEASIHYLSPGGVARATTTIREFLPDLFTFRSYLPDFVPAAAPAAPPSVEAVTRNILREGSLETAEIAAWLKGLSPVDHASKVAQSVVLKLSNGFYVAGTRVEEAAFLDISAVQSAAAVAAGQFGAFTVEEAWVYSRGRDDKALPAGHIGGLPLSSLQVLLEFSQGSAVDVHYLSADGVLVREKADPFALAPVSRQPYQKI